MSRPHPGGADESLSAYEEGAALGKDAPSLVRYFTAEHKLRTAIMVFFFVGAGLAEGLGLVTLLPILELVISSGGTAEATGPAQAMETLLRFVGLPLTLEVLLASLVILFGLKALAILAANQQAGFIIAEVAMELRLELLRRLLAARWLHFTQYPTGYLANAISNEAQRTAQAFREFTYIISDSVLVLTYAVVVVMLSWQTAVAGLFVGGVVTWVLRGFVGESREAGRGHAVLMRNLIARLTGALPGLKAIKAMAREDYVLPLLEDETRGIYTAQRRGIVAFAMVHALQEPIVVAALALGLWGVVTLTSMPFASVIVMAALFYRLAVTIANIQRRALGVAEGEASYKSLQEHIYAARDNAEAWSGTGPAPRVEHGITIENVTFSYSPEKRVLDSVSAQIRQGELVALVGPSGEGKTTLSDIIMGLLTPDEGRVLVDGQDIGDMEIHAWRRRIGYVPQEPLLFSDSVLRNVTLGDPELSEEDAEEALRMAGAWDFVSSLTGGIHHELGERGGTLSGGQRQRVALARALVGAPRVLILDEPTAALDAATEAAICATLDGLKGAMTIIAVSHQPAVQTVADRVLLLQAATIEEIQVAGAGR